jgi:tRNA threonylcarbamoyladenosine biosynthesis protein TsaB
LLLAIDSATRSLGLALHDGKQLIAEQVWTSRGYHTVELAPEIALLLGKTGLSPRTLTAIAVARGPGSFTGLRIGLALAKGFALAHKLPIVGVPTLDILAASQPKREEPMFAVIRAGRGRIAGLWYKWDSGGWVASDELEGLTWEEFLENLETPTYLSGEIIRERRLKLEKDPRIQLASPALSLRRPGFLSEIAWERIRSGEDDDPASLAPIYLKTRSGI